MGNNFGRFPKAISWNYWATLTAGLSVRPAWTARHFTDWLYSIDTKLLRVIELH